jgi:hypothetical protein
MEDNQIREVVKISKIDFYLNLILLIMVIVIIGIIIFFIGLGS